MSEITIVGGVYHERCIWPDWDQLYGSAGRAAAALSGHVDRINLKTYARDDTQENFKANAKTYGFDLDTVPSEQTISFEYVHSLSVPVIRPSPSLIKSNRPIDVRGDVVLRFGMMEGTARVDANCCVYDPQSAFAPEVFGASGSKAKRLAIVGNRGEIIAMGRANDELQAANNLIKNGAEVVVIKGGAAGAHVIGAAGAVAVPAFRTDRVWKIGSGDVFAAVFASEWGVHGANAADAARRASRAVASYVDTMSLPVPPVSALDALSLVEARSVPGRIYLAGPFFTLGQRWLVDEARRCLSDFALDVFSPVHDVGPGPAATVAPADLLELDRCDAVFAILDGNDPGTVFEVGYARAKQKPIYALAQTVSEEDLKMVTGSECRVFDDFVSALHHVAWRT